MARNVDLTGHKSGQLTAARYLGNSVWECNCTCGGTKNLSVLALRRQSTQSCGCTHGNIIHGMARTPTYESWCHMHQRCSNPKSRQWRWYGALGVSVDPSWKSFSGFLLDMGERPTGTVLDRIDPTKNYAPSNCRWTPLKGSKRRNTPMIGTLTLKEYATKHGIKYHTAYARWKKTAPHLG